MNAYSIQVSLDLVVRCYQTNPGALWCAPPSSCTFRQANRAGVAHGPLFRIDIERSLKQCVISLHIWKLFRIILRECAHPQFSAWTKTEIGKSIAGHFFVARLLSYQGIERFRDAISNFSLNKPRILGFEDVDAGKSVSAPIGCHTPFRIRRPLHVQMAVILSFEVINVFDLSQQPMILQIGQIVVSPKDSSFS